MFRSWLRIAAAILSCLPAAARAQSSWGGGYAGLDVTAQFGSASNVTGSVAPYQYPGFAAPYQFNAGRDVPVTLPSTGFSGMSFGTGAYGGGRGGYLFDLGPVVLGLEGQIQFGRMTNAVTVPASYNADAVNICAGGNIGCLTGRATDTLAVRTNVDTSGSLRLRAGLPIGDRVLAGVFAGPSFVAVTMKASQLSQATAFNIFYDGFHFLSNETPESAQTSATRSAVLPGGTIGASIDYRIAPHWVLHGEYAFSAYAPMTMTEGAGTQIRFQPVLHAISGGIAYQF